ncbi:MAG: radical SAM protein [Deltaproteobacteria bacterium]|nr:radical SAM protein [Deltaproteobacteria bacterium]
MLKVFEIYKSIQGESSWVGQPCVFIRLTGCDLRCSWCDTEEAFSGGQWISIQDILIKVESYQCRLIEVTGGEPLLQKETPMLIQSLIQNEYSVLVETGGHLDISSISKEAAVIMDIKCPASGESLHNRWDNLSKLKPVDEIKFVISDKSDYEWAKKILQTKLIGLTNIIHFSPVHEKLPSEELTKWILMDNLPVRLGIQLHKYLNVP